MRNRILFVVGWLLLCLTVPTLAQLSEDGKTFTFSNGLTLSIPDEWKAAQQDDTQSDFIAVDDGRTGLSLFLYVPETLESQNIETGADLINAHYSTVYKSGIDKNTVEDVTLEKQDGATYFGSVETDTDEYEQAAYAFFLPDGTALLGLIYPMTGSGLRKTSQDDALPLIESVLQQVGDLAGNSDDSSDTGINLPDIGPADHESEDAPPADGEGQNGEIDQGPHDFGYRTVLTLPEGWTFDRDEGSSVWMTDGSTKIEIAFYTPHRAGLKGRDAEDLLLDYFKNVNNAENNPIDTDKIEETDIADLDAIRYDTQYDPGDGDEYELTVLSVILPNEAGIIAALYPTNDTALDNQADALSVVEDFIADQPAALDVVDLGYNILFDVPRGWAVYDLKDSLVEFDNGSTSLVVRTYYPSIVEESRMRSAEDVLTHYMENTYPDAPFRARDTESIDLGKLDGVRFAYDAENGVSSETFPRVIIATMLDDEQRVLVADIVPIQGDRLVGEDEIVELFSDIAADIDDLPDEFVFTDESVLDIPRGWWYYESTEDYFLTLENETTGLFLGQYTPQEIEGISDGEEMLEFYNDESIPSSQVETVEVGGVEGVRYETTVTNSAGEEFDRIEYAFILPNDYALIVIIYDLYETTVRERDALPVLEDYLEQYK